MRDPTDILKRVLEREAQKIFDKARSYGPLQSLRYEFGPLDYRKAGDGATEVRPQIVAGFVADDAGWIRMDDLVKR